MASFKKRKQDIYIVGYSLRLPNSDNLLELHENLLNKVNMVSEMRPNDLQGYSVPSFYLGKLKQSIDYFDNVFFGIHGKQAEKLDPQYRLLLETSFEALIDAGISLEEIKGSSTGVYSGVCFSDAHNLWMRQVETMTGYEHSGCAASMTSNRLSYYFDLHGPSLMIDTACSSSLVALHYAIEDLEREQCDTALVGGSSILLRTSTHLGFLRLQMLSPDGFCKTFDESANGYSRAEGVVCLLLTTRPDFIRYTPHAKILASAVNACGHHDYGISYPSRTWQAALYQEVLEKATVNPTDIQHIECHGTGTKVGDIEELAGIKLIFQDRSDLTLGALKSNLGHTEGASGLAGIAKLLLSYETGYHYPQLHLKNKIPDLSPLCAIVEAQPWSNPGKAIVNSFGFGGTNACALIDTAEIKNNTLHKRWHELHFINARTKEGLYLLKRALEKTPQQLPLLNNLHYVWREVVGLPDDPQLVPMEYRPLFLAFSGNGSQWLGMGIQLMRASSLFKGVLSKCGKDIPKLLTQGWKGVVNETRVLTAIQIALVELLSSLGIKADGYIAHSAGEIAASFASGATTLKETMAIAKARGEVAETMPQGLMLSVGLSAKDVLPYLDGLNKISIACINSPRNITLSGDVDQINRLETLFISARIFTRRLNTQGKPYHSSLIDRSAVKKILSKAYKRKTTRNSTWCSAIQRYDPDFFSIDYHIESMVRPVDFLSAMSKVPSNAIILEIGPHHVLRSLSRDCSPETQYVSLMAKEDNDYISFKEGLGRLWKLGVNITIEPDWVRPPLAVRAAQTAWDRTYFPVPRDDQRQFKHEFIFDLKGDDAYLLGHAIDNKPIFPAMGMVYLFWQTYLRYYPQIEVVTLDEFRIVRSIPLVGDQLTLEVLATTTGLYHLLFHEELIAEAKLGRKETKETNKEPAYQAENFSLPSQNILSKPHFYRRCHRDGYTYQTDFQAIEQVALLDSCSKAQAKIHFNHWISFLDSLLQLSILLKPVSGLFLPTSIRHIELSQHYSNIVTYNRFTNRFECGSIVIQGLETTEARRARDIETVFFQKEDYFPLGHQQLCPEKSDYLNNLLSFSATQYMSISESLHENHYQRLKEILKKHTKQVNIEHLEKPANAYYYQLIQDLYKQPKELLDKPISSIVGHPHYAHIYHDDFMYDLQYIKKAISVVRQHVRQSMSMSIFEIGTGTGGLLKQIGRFLYPRDNIYCSDITGNQIIHNEDTAHLHCHYLHVDINQPLSPVAQEKIANSDLTLASNALHTSLHLQKTLQTLHDLMKPGAFMLLIEFTSPLCLPLFGLEPQTWAVDDEREFGMWASCARWKSLFKETHFNLISYLNDPNELLTIFFIRKPLSKQDYKCIEAPTKHYHEEWANPIKQSTQPILLYNKKPGGMAGLARTLSAEGKRTISFCASNPEMYLNEVLTNELATSVLCETGLATRCYQPAPDKTLRAVDAYHVEFSKPGNLDHYVFVKNKPFPGKTCQVAFAALNYRDVMLASGKINKSTFLGFSKHGSGVGMEFSGLHDGKAIMGVALDALANIVRTDYCWDVPSAMSLSEAATIPVAYLTVYYSFYERASIQPHHKVLIHGGAGAVGQAAIRVALSVGCEVFTTCQKDKRDYLKALFPKLNDTHIGDSRSTNFESLILEQTQGKGVDIILNSLSDDKLQASLNCLAQHGAFIEIGKYDLMRNTPIGLKHFLPNTSFFGVDIDQVFNDPVLMKRLSTRLLDGLSNGVVKPLDQTTFSWKSLSDAFRFLGSGQHRGKVLIDMHDIEPQIIEDRFYTSGAHLIVGGLGGLGMELAEWLAERGAEELILISRHGITQGEQTLFVERVKLNYPTLKIHICSVNLICPDEAKAFLTSCQPLTGVYNLAMVLNDCFFEDMTEASWEETIACKITITEHLHDWTQHHPIEQFVCFSSIAVLGNPGQTNYAFANNAMESICYARQESGLPALAIQWGPIDETGFIANQTSLYQNMINNAFGGSLSTASFLRYLECCLLGDATVNLVFRSDKTTLHSFDEPEDMLAKIGKILKINLAELSDSIRLVELGMDSLQSAEIQALLSQISHQNIPISELITLTIGDIKNKFLETNYSQQHVSAQLQEEPQNA